ncbi:MAG TPA: DUF2322 family protein [Methylophilaceae bacterium]|nr:DUF2322 family protein [Methylophilaceae bacterium]
MKKFSDILPTLENADHLQAIELLNADGTLAGVIVNKPGSQGSVKLYHHLWKNGAASIVKQRAKDWRFMPSTWKMRKTIRASIRT